MIQALAQITTVITDPTIAVFRPVAERHVGDFSRRAVLAKPSPLIAEPRPSQQTLGVHGCVVAGADALKRGSVLGLENGERVFLYLLTGRDIHRNRKNSLDDRRG